MPVVSNHNAPIIAHHFEAVSRAQDRLNTGRTDALDVDLNSRCQIGELLALTTKLVMTCCSWAASTSDSAVPPQGLKTNSVCRLSAMGRSSFSVSSSKRLRSVVARCGVLLRAKFSSSCTIAVILCDCDLIVRALSTISPAESFPLAINSALPDTTFSGVPISCARPAAKRPTVRRRSA